MSLIYKWLVVNLCVNDAVMKLLLVLVLMCTGLVTASDGQCPTDLPNTSAMSLFLETCYQFVTEERYWNDASDYCIQVPCVLLTYGT